jgi:hypothetical protein
MGPTSWKAPLHSHAGRTRFGEKNSLRETSVVAQQHLSDFVRVLRLLADEITSQLF